MEKYLPVTKGYFLRNLLMSENNELKNRYMHIRWEETTHSDGKQHIKRHIEQHIENKNDILETLNSKEISLSDYSLFTFVLLMIE